MRFILVQMITLGGNAELELVDSMDPFSEGIIFSVMPPKKSWKNISNLSGGEKVTTQKCFWVKSLSEFHQTLSSLALVFALHVFKVCNIVMFTSSRFHCYPRSLRHCTSWTKSTPH